MTNQHTAERIVHALQYRKCVVEVGPGRGILTNILVDSCDRLILVEKDDDLAAELDEQFTNTPHVTVINADFLQADLQRHSGEEQFALIGNFPYNISSQIIFRMLVFKEQIPEMVGMFQREMARRIISGPGSKEYGVISVLAQTAYQGEHVMNVSPGQFSPPPKVDSAVIRLVRKKDISLPCQYKTLRTVVKAAFGQRRKMLRNSLKSLIPPDQMEGDIFQLRPEQIPLETFYMMASMVENIRTD